MNKKIKEFIISEFEEKVPKQDEFIDIDDELYNVISITKVDQITHISDNDCGYETASDYVDDVFFLIQVQYFKEKEELKIIIPLQQRLKFSKE